MLEIRNLSVGYPSPAMVRGISLTVAEAEGVCLIGPNGAGKTTTLRGVLGLAHRITGEIHKDGQAISSSPGSIVKHGVSYVPEGRHVFAQLSVEQNLVVAALALKTPRSVIRERLDSLYSRFPMLSNFRKREAGQLSGGQQQIVAISRALMQQPSVLLIDEPSLGLSPIAVDEVAEVLTGLVSDGLSLLLVEQNIEIALSLCQRGYVLRSGELVGSGTSDELARMNIVEELYFGASA